MVDEIEKMGTNGRSTKRKKRPFFTLFGFWLASKAEKRCRMKVETANKRVGGRSTRELGNEKGEEKEIERLEELECFPGGKEKGGRP